LGVAMSWEWFNTGAGAARIVGLIVTICEKAS
jgi:hypothetical protein